MMISFGELLVDLIKNGNNYIPLPGGAPANFSVALARLGIRSELVASVGKDIYGDMLLDCMRKEDVDISNIQVSDKKTSLVFVELKKGIPSFEFQREADLDIRMEHMNLDFMNARWFHFGSLSLTDNPIRETLFHCLEQAKQH
ncbi:MAG: hypothetical protein KKC05_02610, partial [Nanoarchaeota archaeon]|nr:hypothetical protein [Nanoarchaeota archaeon]